MKQQRFITYLMMMLVFMIHIPAISQTHVFIPDVNFRNFLNASYPTFMDISGDSLIIDSAATVTGTFTCSNQNIADLTGIEYFISVTRLECDSNQLTSLPDLSNISALYRLECNDNQLTSLPDFSNNTALSRLFCDNNQLTSLPDFSANTALYHLTCNNNQLTSIPDLSSNTDLWYLSCNNNQLTGLPNLSANTALSYLYCDNNQLTSLPDLSNNTLLSYLCCNDNQLASLPDLLANTALWRLCCNNNQLTSLPDLSANTNLAQIYCHHNQLTSLPDLSNTSMTVLYCSNNQITRLPDLSSNTDLAHLYIQNNQITDLSDLSLNTALSEFDCSYNQITSLPDFSANSTLWLFYCDQNKLDFSDTRELRIVDTISNLHSFDYEPQSPFGEAYSMCLYEGNTLTLSIASQDSALSYQWFKDENAISGVTDTLLVIPDVTFADSGIYTCRSYGTALECPPMNWGPGISEFVSEPVIVEVKIPSPGPGPDNIMENGDFEACTLSPWLVWIADYLGVTASAVLVDGTCRVSEITLSASPEHWNVQLNQQFTATQLNMLEKDSTYILTFDASADIDNRPCRIAVDQNEEPWIALLDENILIDTETHSYSFEFIVDSVFSVMKLSFQLGLETSPVTFDNVRLVKKVGGNPSVINRPKKNNVKLFPNPASEYLTVIAEDGAIVTLFDNMGAIVKTAIPVNNRLSFKVADLPAGIYFVEICQKEYLSVYKVVIQQNE